MMLKALVLFLTWGSVWSLQVHQGHQGPAGNANWDHDIVPYLFEAEAPQEWGVRVRPDPKYLRASLYVSATFQSSLTARQLQQVVTTYCNVVAFFEGLDQSKLFCQTEQTSFRRRTLLSSRAPGVVYLFRAQLKEGGILDDVDVVVLAVDFQKALNKLGLKAFNIVKARKTVMQDNALSVSGGPCDNNVNQGTCEAELSCKWDGRFCKDGVKTPMCVDFGGEAVCNAVSSCHWSGNSCERGGHWKSSFGYCADYADPDYQVSCTDKSTEGITGCEACSECTDSNACTLAMEQDAKLAKAVKDAKVAQIPWTSTYGNCAAYADSQYQPFCTDTSDIGKRACEACKECRDADACKNKAIKAQQGTSGNTYYHGVADGAGSNQRIPAQWL